MYRHPPRYLAKGEKGRLFDPKLPLVIVYLQQESLQKRRLLLIVFLAFQQSLMIRKLSTFVPPPTKQVIVKTGFYRGG